MDFYHKASDTFNSDVVTIAGTIYRYDSYNVIWHFNEGGLVEQCKYSLDPEQLIYLQVIFGSFVDDTHFCKHILEV